MTICGKCVLKAFARIGGVIFVDNVEPLTVELKVTTKSQEGDGVGLRTHGRLSASYDDEIVRRSFASVGGVIFVGTVDGWVGLRVTAMERSCGLTVSSGGGDVCWAVETLWGE